VSSKNRLKILFISSFYPSKKADSAGVLDAAHLLDELRKRFSITLVSFYDKNDQIEPSDNLNDYLIRNRTFESKFWYLLKTLVSILTPLSSIYFMAYSMRIGRKIKTLLNNSYYDYCVIEFTQMSQYIKKIPVTTKIIIDESDVAFERRNRYIKNNTKGFLKFVLDYDNNKLKENEIKCLCSANVILTRTKRDHDILVRNGLLPKIKNHIFLPWVHFGNGNIGFNPTSKELHIVFFGALWRPVNEEAVLYFISSIFPLVLNKYPSCKFYIAGSRPSKRIKKAESNNIIVTGYIDDISCIYSKAHIAIVPLLSGSGIKGKVIQALGWGLPVIATPIGAEGIELNESDGLIVATDPEDFANSIVQYGTDDIFRKRIFDKKYLISKKYNWSDNVDKFMEILECR
jgi:polysaccharide biosynthesis protein PslH